MSTQHPPAWSYVVAAIAGVALSVSARIGGAFTLAVHNPIEAAMVNFGIGLLILIVIAISLPKVRAQVRMVPLLLSTRVLPWWAFFGGFAGAFYVSTQSFAVPLIGVASFTVAVVAGQTSSSLVIDRFGLGPAGRQIISALRVIGAILTVIAVAIAVSTRFSGAGFSVAAIIAAFAGGVGLATQQALNGRLSVATKQPLAAALVSFALGFFALVVLVLVLNATSTLAWGALPTGPWWIWTSGAMGVTYIAVGAWIVPKVGVLVFGLLTVVGQLAGALMFDVLAPLPGSVVTVQLVLGLALTIVAVTIATWRKKAA